MVEEHGPGDGAQSKTEGALADADARLVVLRRMLTTLESRQRRQEQQLQAWRRSSADEAACARLHCQLLAGELRAVELDGHTAPTTSGHKHCSFNCDNHVDVCCAELACELRSVEAQLSAALERVKRAVQAEANAICAARCEKLNAVAAEQSAEAQLQALDVAQREVCRAHTELASRAAALDDRERQQQIEEKRLTTAKEKLDALAHVLDLRETTLIKASSARPAIVDELRGTPHPAACSSLNPWAAIPGSLPDAVACLDAETENAKLRLELQRALELSGERAERLLQAEAHAAASERHLQALEQHEAELVNESAEIRTELSDALLRLARAERAEDEALLAMGREELTAASARQDAAAQHQALSIAREELSRAKAELARSNEALAAQKREAAVNIAAHKREAAANIAVLTLELLNTDRCARDRPTLAAADEKKSSEAENEVFSSRDHTDSTATGSAHGSDPAHKQIEPAAQRAGAFFNWVFLADRAAALATQADEAQPISLTPPRHGSPSKAGEHESEQSVRNQSTADLCAMLRIEHVGQLIPVLGQVIRVATTVPELERMRDVLKTNAADVDYPRDQSSTATTSCRATESVQPSQSCTSDHAPIATLLYRCGREMQQAHAFEHAVTRMLGAEGRGCSRSRLLMVLRGRLARDCTHKAGRGVKLGTKPERV